MFDWVLRVFEEVLWVLYEVLGNTEEVLYCRVFSFPVKEELKLDEMTDVGVSSEVLAEKVVMI